MSSFDPRHRADNISGQIAIALYRVSQAIGYLFRKRGTEQNLSPAQIQALLFLHYSRMGVRTIGGLSSRLASSYATTSGVVDALENKGFVKRQPLPSDQRTITLQLTAAGIQKTGLVDDVLEVIESAISDLSPDKQQAFIDVMQHVVGRLQAAGHVEVYEMCWGCQFFRQDAHPETPNAPHHCAFVDAPLEEPSTLLECPDFIPINSL